MIFNIFKIKIYLFASLEKKLFLLIFNNGQGIDKKRKISNQIIFITKIINDN